MQDIYEIENYSSIKINVLKYLIKINVFHIFNQDFQSLYKYKKDLKI